MRKITIALIFSIFFGSGLYSQNSFRYTKVKNGVYETVFTVLGIYDSSMSSDIINQILKVEGIKEAKIFYNRRCKITSNKPLNFNKIRNIVKQYNADFQLGYCIIKDKKTYVEISDFSENNKITDYKPQIIPAKEWVFPSDFPTKEKYSTQEELKKAKQQWIENNPYKWRDITGLEYLDFSINLNFKTK